MKQLIGAMFLLVVLAGTACGGGYGAPKPAAATPSPGKPGEISVSATYPRFQPSTVAVKKGEVVQLKVSATDANHTFTIDELGINIAVGRGQTITEEIKTEKTGAFTFYCAVPGHRSAGMEGTLQIAE